MQTNRYPLHGHAPPPRCRGFTLMELMIVVVMAAIIAAIAVPAYKEQARTARRATAHAALQDAASRQEQFFLDNKTYTTTIGPGGLNMSATSEGDYYAIEVDAPTAACAIDRCYKLTARPQGAQAGDSCDPITLDIDHHILGEVL